MFVPLSKEFNLWSESEKIIFIEDVFWMSQKPECLQEIKYEILDIDYDEFGVNEEQMWAFAIRLSELAGEILNRFHCTSYTHQYWRRVLFPWIKCFVPAIYLRFLRLRALRDRYPNEVLRTVIFNEKGSVNIPLNAEELLQPDGTFVDAYGHHLYGSILRSVDFEIDVKTLSQTVRQVGERENEPDIREKRQSIIQRVLHKVKKPYKTLKICVLYSISKIISFFASNRVEIVLSDFGSRYLGSKLNVLSWGKVAWCYSQAPVWIPLVNTRPNVQYSFRQTAEAELRKMISPSSECERILLHLFFQEIPYSYVENFKECCTVHADYYKQFPHLKYILSFAGAEFTESKMAMCKQGERGVKFSYIAHGSIRPQKSDRFLFGRIISDLSYLWGAIDKNTLDQNVINYRQAPAEKLFIYDKLSTHSSSKILYIGDWASPFLHRLHYHTLGRLLQQERNFLSALDPEVRKHIVIRNYPYKFTRLLDRWIKYYFQDISISRSEMGGGHEVFPQLLMDSRLIILDHAETPFLEALYANKPFLLYFDKKGLSNYFDPDTEQVYVDMMCKEGLIQYGADNAGKYLNSIYLRIEEWWNEPERQAVIKVLRERYAGSYMDPDEWWTKEIMGLLNGEITW